MTTGARTQDLRLFIPIAKIDEEKRLVYGTITEEALDKSGEVLDYASSKPFFEKWSSEFAETTKGKSRGNLRVMHTNQPAGKITALDFDDAAKRITCVAKITDDQAWKQCLEGVYTGFSHGGFYERRWEDDDKVKRYTANPHEVSIVDNPCLSTARFDVLKADGAVEQRAFKSVQDETPPAAVEKPGDQVTDETKTGEQKSGEEEAATNTAGEGTDATEKSASVQGESYAARKARLQHINDYLRKGSE